MLDFIDKPINPPGPYRFTAISTFAGCGGSSLGYKWAGGKVLAAVEWDQNAVDTYRLNHEGTPVLHRDIATVAVDELLALTGLAPGELDILDGSPPCQGFSTAGKRDMDDSRNQLFHEYARLLRGLRPKVFVMENVSGMVKGKMKLIFAEVLRTLKGCGYHVSARLMNAMYFGVPQSRERMIFIGVREDLRIEPSHPRAQTRPIVAGDVLALADFSSALTAPQFEFWQAIRPGQYGRHAGLGNVWFNFVRLDPDAIAPTVCKGAGNAKHTHWDAGLRGRSQPARRCRHAGSQTGAPQ